MGRDGSRLRVVAQLGGVMDSDLESDLCERLMEADLPGEVAQQFVRERVPHPSMSRADNHSAMSTSDDSSKVTFEVWYSLGSPVLAGWKR